MADLPRDFKGLQPHSARRSNISGRILAGGRQNLRHFRSH